MIASAKEIDALNITLFNSFINFTNVHLRNYCTKIFVIVVNTCVCRRSVDNKALILSYPMKYQESDLHLGLYSSLTSANNNVGSCWPTMLRPFGRGFSLLGLRYMSLALLKKLM